MELRTAGPFTPRRWPVVMCLLSSLAIASSASAQSAPDSNTATTAQPVAEIGDEAVLSPAEPDVVVVNLPTGMQLPVFKGNFRLTHRFAGNLRRGTFGQQAGNLFGIDQGAIIGFEYRIAVARHVQAAFYRSSFDKTIQLHGQYKVVGQRRSLPVSTSIVASIEGTDNFQQKYSPAIGVVVSRLVGTRAAAYVTPLWVDNTAASLAVAAHDHDHGTGETPAEHAARRSTTIL